jgi:hypothetical protein
MPTPEIPYFGVIIVPNLYNSKFSPPYTCGLLHRGAKNKGEKNKKKIVKEGKRDIEPKPTTRCVDEQ